MSTLALIVTGGISVALIIQFGFLPVFIASVLLAILLK